MVGVDKFRLSIRLLHKKYQRMDGHFSVKLIIIPSFIDAYTNIFIALYGTDVMSWESQVVLYSSKRTLEYLLP